MRRPDEVLSRLHLLEHAWDFAYENRSNVIDVYIRHLRNKIDEPFGRHSLETVRGAGYRLRRDGGFDATADPPARVGRVRCRDGGRARPLRRHPLRPLGLAPVARARPPAAAARERPGGARQPARHAARGRASQPLRRDGRDLRAGARRARPRARRHGSARSRSPCSPPTSCDGPWRARSSRTAARCRASTSPRASSPRP